MSVKEVYLINAQHVITLIFYYQITAVFQDVVQINSMTLKQVYVKIATLNTAMNALDLPKMIV